MTRKAVPLLPLLSSVLLSAFASTAVAQSTTPPEDPFKPVFVVAARDTYTDHMAHAARNPLARRGHSGEALVLAELKSHQLLDISQRIHREEHHCGGYFAFDTQAEAEAFIRNGASTDAIAAAVSYTVDNQATVGAWLPQVQEANIRGTISHLSGNYRNRYYTTTTGKSAAAWIRDRWLALAAGRTDVSAELFTACGNCATQPSVILTVQGSELPGEIVVVGGHLDSISNSGSGESMLAPGADDDASGIATITEVVRVALASGWKPKRTVKFMGYAAEEVGLRGSNAIAQSFRNSGQNVVGVLQLDMTNYAGASNVDMRIVSDYASAELKTFFAQLFDTYLAPLGLSRGTETCGYACSDHASWTNAGFPAAMMAEPEFFGSLHTTGDTLANMGNTAAVSVNLAKFGLAFVGELGKTAGSGGGTAPVLINKVPLTNLSGAAGSSQYWTMSVPAGASNLRFTSSGGSGDADLYAQFGTQPTTTSFACKSAGSTNNETCAITMAQAGTYHVMLRGYSAYSGLTLTGSFDTGALVYSNTTDYPISDNATVDSPVTVSGRSGNASSTAKVAVDIKHTYKGDLKVDLVAPDGTLYNIHNRTGSSTDNVIGTFTLNLSSEVLNGTWKLRVNDNASGDTGYIDSWSFTP